MSTQERRLTAKIEAAFRRGDYGAVITLSRGIRHPGSDEFFDAVVIYVHRSENLLAALNDWPS